MKITMPLKNTLFDKIKEARSITDSDLYKIITKGGHIISEDKYNKLLLDLEILGLIKVAWITKDERRIEVVEEPTVDEEQSRATERDYEASFPGFEK